MASAVQQAAADPATAPPGVGATDVQLLGHGFAVSAGDDRPRLTGSEVAALSARLSEPAALAALRSGGLGHYRACPPPERSAHLWRYTDPASLMPRAPLRAAGAPRSRPPVNLGDAAGVVALMDGAPTAVALSEVAARAGVQLAPLEEIRADAERLGTAVAPDHGLFEALNTAAWSSGVVVTVPRWCKLERPIRIVVPASARTTLPRVLIVLEAGAEATVIEEHVGGAPSGHVVGVTEIFAGPAAQLHYTVLEDWSPNLVGHLTTRLVLARDAQALTVVHSFGGSRLKMDLGAVLDGPGAHSELVGFALAESSQHVDTHLVHHHRAGKTGSNIDFKVALTDQARAATTGLIRIDAGAAESEAYQEQRNLLLSDRCRADAIPELEIETNEVHCSHGATSSPVDKEQLFYLHSRGIPPATATGMVVRGFFEGALRRLPAGLRETVTDRVEQRIERLCTQ